MKKSLISKLGISLGLATAVYFASPAFARAEAEIINDDSYLTTDDSINANFDDDSFNAALSDDTYTLADAQEIKNTYMPKSKLTGHFFREKLLTFTKDNYLSRNEAEELFNLIKGDEGDIQKKYQIKQSFEKLNQEKGSNALALKKVIASLREFPDFKNKDFKKRFEVQKELLEQKVLIYYPELVSDREEVLKRKAIIYNADTLIDSKILSDFKKIIDSASGILNEAKLSNPVKIISDKDEANLRVRDLAAFYSIISKINLPDNVSLPPELSERKEDFEKRKAFLAQQRVKINSQMDFLSQEDKKIQGTNLHCFSEFTNYLNLKNFSDEIKKESSIRKYIGTSISHYISLDMDNFYKRDFAEEQDKAISSLKECLEPSVSNYKMEIEELKNPQSAMLPAWFNLFFGIGFPIAVKSIMPRYWSKRKVDGFDIVSTISITTLGFSVLDAIHPLVYPIRLLYPIFLEETIRKRTGWKKPLDGNAHRRR